MKKIPLVIILTFSLALFLKTEGVNANTFNPNYIISDSEILDYSSMNLSSIQALLERKGSYLANYSATDPDGVSHKASQIIYDRAITNKINPKFLIVLLQKEMSLIEDSSPKESQLNWATGYGCPDGASCNTRWKGFWKQVNSASLQFIDYMENPHLYTYKAGNTYTFTNPYSTINNEINIITPANLATAALYNYTPHVYNGNYNFYNIWQRYFTKEYTDGSLLQAEGEIGVWLLQNGMKRPFHSRGALTSRFDENKIITVTKSDLDKYETGVPIKFANYSFVRSPGGTVFLLVDDKKRGFADGEALRKIGINPEEIVNGSWQDVNAYTDGKPITATSTYPTGALLQNNKTGGVYWVFEGKKAPIIDAVFLKTKFKHKILIPVKPDELNTYITIDPVLLDDGELVKSPTSPTVYLLSNGAKRPFSSGKDFEDLGYKWENIITVSSKVLYFYPLGEVIINE